MSNKGSDPDVIPLLEKDGVTYYTNKEKATILNQFFINQSTTEDNDDVPDVPELLTSINQINLSAEEVKKTHHIQTPCKFAKHYYPPARVSKHIRQYELINI